ncbi:MAG: alpha/beta fold hydrolase, partial [Bacteroidota bacterium]
MSEPITREVKTSRISIHYLSNDHPQAQPILFIHGNVSSAVFWKKTIANLPTNYFAVAPDLRGYGHTEGKIVDATQGLNDFVKDLDSFIEALKLEKFHLIGHSLGGGVALNLLLTQADKILSATLVNPMSPYGYGGTKDEKGTPCFEDFAGSGGGIVNPAFVKKIAMQDHSEDDPNAPLAVMNNFYWKPPFRSENEKELLEAMLSQKTGEKHYPGDLQTSSNFPFVAPGKFGPINALSPKYLGYLPKDLWALPKKP